MTTDLDENPVMLEENLEDQPQSREDGVTVAGEPSSSSPQASSQLTPESLLSMARYLGIDVEGGHEFYLLSVAREAASATLAHPWEVLQDESGAPRYVNQVTRQTLDRHPLDDRFLALVQRSVWGRCAPAIGCRQRFMLCTFFRAYRRRGRISGI